MAAPPVSMKALLEAGVHFGHQTRRWDPQMRPFIFTERNGIHIIDLQQTVRRLDEAGDGLRRATSSPAAATLLFVGTKKQAQETIEQEATRCGMPYVNSRWLGGTLTNFQTIQGRIDHLVRLEDARDARRVRPTDQEGSRSSSMNEIERLNRYFGGIKEMTRLPAALFIVDPQGAHRRRRGAAAWASRSSRMVRHQLQPGPDRLPDPGQRRRHPRHQAASRRDRRRRPRRRPSSRGRRESAARPTTIARGRTPRARALAGGHRAGEDARRAGRRTTLRPKTRPLSSPTPTPSCARARRRAGPRRARGGSGQRRRRTAPTTEQAPD